MPNWIEGTLKIRGDYERIRKFFTQGIDNPAGNFEDKPINFFVTDDRHEGWSEIRFRNDPHIKDTNRAFVAGSYVYIEPGLISCIEIKQAWDFDICDWMNISKCYGIDIRLYGFEMGMEFCREIEVLNGQLTINKKIKYQNYQWECPMPLLGG